MLKGADMRCAGGVVARGFSGWHICIGFLDAASGGLSTLRAMST